MPVRFRTNQPRAAGCPLLHLLLASLVGGCAASKPTAVSTSPAPSAAPADVTHAAPAHVDPKVEALAEDVERMSAALRAEPMTEAVSQPDLPADVATVAETSEQVPTPVISEARPLVAEPAAPEIVVAPTPGASEDLDWSAPAEAAQISAEHAARTSQPTLRETILARARKNPRSAASVFDYRLLQILTAEDAEVLPLGSLRPEDERIIATVTRHLSQFRQHLDHGSIDPRQRIEPFLEAADTLRREAGLTLPMVALCSEVRLFGSYEPLTPSFTTGTARQVVLYVEVDNFQTRRADDGWWETRISLAATLYDPDGKPVMSLPPYPATDRSRQRRRDFFLSGLLTLPAQTRPGPHMLKVTVKDELGRRVAQESIKVQFVAAEPQRGS